MSLFLDIEKGTNKVRVLQNVNIMFALKSWKTKNKNFKKEKLY